MDADGSPRKSTVVVVNTIGSRGEYRAGEKIANTPLDGSHGAYRECPFQPCHGSHYSCTDRITTPRGILWAGLLPMIRIAEGGNLSRARSWHIALDIFCIRKIDVWELRKVRQRAITPLPRRIRAGHPQAQDDGRRAMTKKKAKLPAQPAPRKEIPAGFYRGESRGRAIARALISPTAATARILSSAECPANREHIDMPDLMGILQERAKAVQEGDLSGIEAMLTNQATALQGLFVRLAERGMGCETLPGFEGNMRMALRAQNQARATLETLATIKNPPVVFARQANIANGPQQVNNGTPRAEIETAPNKVLQEMPHERMDAGTPGKTGRSNPTLETVAAVHRPANRRG